MPFDGLLRAQAILRPSGAQPTGLCTSPASRRGVPPRNGTRHRANWRLRPRMKSTWLPSGVTVTPRMRSPGIGGTICTLLVVVVCRIHRLSFEPSVCTYATYLPLGDTAGSEALPVVVNCVIARF